MPISFRYASAENESRLACWFFQPKRATRLVPPASVTGTLITLPQIAPFVRRHCWSASWRSAFDGIASMNPSPSVLSDARSARMFSLAGARC